MSEVVLEALRQYRPRRRQPSPQKQVELWRRLLRQDRKGGMIRPEAPVDELYDEATGLPK